MRKLIIMFIFMIPVLLKGQNKGADATLKLTVLTATGDTVSGTRLWLVEDFTKEREDHMTDTKGEAEFIVYTGLKYYLNFPDEEDYSVIEIPTDSGREISRTITYTPGKAEIIVYDTLKQSYTKESMPESGQARIMVVLEGNGETAPEGLKVKLRNKEDKKVYLASTSSEGKAVFMVVPGRAYDVYVGDAEKSSIINLPDHDRIEFKRTLKYLLSHVKETIKKDTITQQITAKDDATTDRVLLTVTVNDLENKALNGEAVYFSDMGSKKVYKCITNSSDMAKVLLPKGYKYKVGFKYEGLMDMIDIRESMTISHQEATYRYRGSAAIEKYFAEVKRNKKGFRTEFPSTPLPDNTSARKKRTAPNGQVIAMGFVKKKTSYGFDLLFERQDYMASPLIHGSSIITALGYFSRDMYSYDIKTNKLNWSITLNEAGASPSVYNNGVILVNTESCTLYAIDASTGRLLWQHWLSPYLYSTPTVDSGKVYVSYSDQAARPGKTSNYVIACFDLKSGDIVWQNWLNEEGISSPVIAGHSVYVSSRDGSLAAFNRNNGEKIYSDNIGALTAPLIVKNRLYISRKNASGEQYMAVYNARDLTEVKGFSKAHGNINGLVNAGCISSMNHNGSRPLAYKGKSYYMVGGNLYCNSLTDGHKLWSKKVETSVGVELMPVIVAGMVIIADDKGKISLLSAEDGTVGSVYQTGKKINSQPIVHNGWIYAGSNDGKIAAVNTGNTSLTGWEMWNKDAKHNMGAE